MFALQGTRKKRKKETILGEKNPKKPLKKKKEVEKGNQSRKLSETPASITPKKKEDSKPNKK